jgi:hypothetical protein
MRSLRALAGGLVAVGLAVAPAQAQPLELTWADLIPASAVLGERATILQGIIQHAQVSNTPENASQTTQSIEALMGIASPVEYRTDLEGREVTLFGYVLPIVFEGSAVTEFLLVPFVGACIHVPAPPANQLVYVTVPGGYPVSGVWEPVEVTGVLSIPRMSTDLAEIGYGIAASAVQKAQV